MSVTGFIELSQNSGVDADRAFMVVPVGQSNLIVHDRGKGAVVEPDRMLSVKDITDDLRLGMGSVFQTLARSPLFGGIEILTKLLLQVQLPPGPDNRLLLVSGTVAGVFSLSVKKGGLPSRLTVYVANKLSRSLTFRFLRYSGGGSKWTKADAPAVLDKLNWVYNNQANIHFDLKRADDFNVPAPGNDQVDEDFIDNNLASGLDNTTDFTVFFVPKFVPKRSNAIAFHHGKPGLRPSFCVVQDNPTGIPVHGFGQSDQFLVLLAHEIGHALGVPGGGDHPQDDGVLCGAHYEGLKINKVVMEYINPPKK